MLPDAPECVLTASESRTTQPSSKTAPKRHYAPLELAWPEANRSVVQAADRLCYVKVHLVADISDADRADIQFHGHYYYGN